jgi:pilus assembly protein CpaE
LPDTRVLLLGDASSDAIARVLAEHNRFLTRVEDPDEAVRVAPEHQIFVIDAVPPPRTVASVCRDIRAVPELSELPVLAISASDNVEERIRLLESGADDVMVRPVDERELDARIEALDLRFRRSKERRPATVVSSTRRGGRRLIAVFSPKGGVGTTTVAVNVALAIAAREPDQVAIVDLAPVTGSVVTHLNAEPRLTITDLARDSLAIADPEMARTYLHRHGKLDVLAGSTGPGVAALIGPENVTTILDNILTAVPTVVVDAGSHLDERVIPILELADNVVLVVTPDFAALKSLHTFLEYLNQIGSQLTDPMIVVNEMFARQMLTPADIEGALQKRVTVRIPYDQLLFLRAVNEGNPVFNSASSSPPARRFDELAAVLLGEDAPQSTPDRRSRRLGGLFRRN